MWFWTHWCLSEWLYRPAPNERRQFDGQQVNHIELQLARVYIKTWQMTIIAQVPKTEAAVKKKTKNPDRMEVIFRPQGTRQRSPASCATSCVMASPREVRVNYIRNSKTSLMWCCDTAEGFFFPVAAGAAASCESAAAAAAAWPVNSALIKWAAALLPLPACSATNKTADEQNPIMDQCPGLFVVRQEQDSEALD